MQLGDHLKKLREERKMSQDDLAKAMNVSRQAVYKWESNKGYPDIENIRRLSEIYNVSIDELIKGKHNERKTSTHENEEFSDDDAGFYLGILFVFIGIFTDFHFMVMVGFLTMVFYEELIKVIRSLKKDWKEG